jgi:hypothetical protein
MPVTYNLSHDGFKTWTPEEIAGQWEAYGKGITHWVDPNQCAECDSFCGSDDYLCEKCRSNLS